MSVGRHPLAGLAACFAGVAAIFGVNLLIGPNDAMLVEITNEALALGGRPAHHDRVQPMVRDRVLDRARGHRGDRLREDHRAAAGSVDGRRHRRGHGCRADPGQAGHRRAPRTPRASSGRASPPWAACSWCSLLTLPPGAPLRDPVTGDDRGSDAVHGQPAVHHHDAVPGRGRGLRLRRRAPSRARTTSSRRS